MHCGFINCDKKYNVRVKGARLRMSCGYLQINDSFAFFVDFKIHLLRKTNAIKLILKEGALHPVTAKFCDILVANT